MSAGRSRGRHGSADQGGSWTSIAGNLPDVPANDILVDPADPEILYLATDVGVYVSQDQGGYWLPLGSGMPIQTIFDLTFHAPSRTLVAATAELEGVKATLEFRDQP